MRSDVLRRVRWGNVARALGVLAVAGVIVAWPRLTPPEPSVPEPAPRPLVEPRDRAVEPAPLTEAELRGGERAPREDGRERRSRRGDGSRSLGRSGDRPRRPHREARVGRQDGGRGDGGESPGVVAPAPSQPSAPARGPMPAAPVIDPAQAEFGIEGG